ncbi:MAG: ABC transporter permease [Nitrospirae bacterium]|nr:ABC transporter permease [Nitrospirota bacterium]MCL5236738.1 ABC transporter permease [Nitrospirota bacterium]
MKTGLNTFSIAVKNLRRKIIRTALLFLAVTVVTGTLFSATLFISSMRNALKIGTYRLGADVLVVPEKYVSEARTALLAGEPTSFYMDRAVYEKVKRVEGVKQASPQLFIKPASFTCCYSVDVFLIAFEPATDFTIAPWLEKNLKKPLSGDEIITGREVPLITGDTVPFFGTPFKVIGTMEPTGMKFFDRSAFMTMDAAYTMAANSKANSMQPIDLDRSRISAVLVRVQDGYTPDRVAIRLEHDIEGIKAIASDEIINTVRKQLGGLLKGILAVSAVLWILALLMMGFAFSMMVNERQRELGLLRAMGAKRGYIFRLIITEAVIISAAGGIAGLAGGSVLLLAFKGPILSSLKLPYLVPSATVLAELTAGALVFAMITGLLSSLLPAISASTMEPYAAIRKGE